MFSFDAAMFGGPAAYAGGGGGPWTPASLTGLKGWWEAGSSALFQSNAGTTSAVANNDVVGYVTDKSGNGNHLKSTANDTTRPTLQGVGVRPVIRFDGVNDLISCAALNLYNGGSCSIFVAGKVNPGGTTKVICGECSTSSTIPFYLLLSSTSTATTMSMFIRNDASSSILTGANTPNLTSALNNADAVLGMTDSGTLVSEYLDQGAAVTVAETRSGTLTLNNFCVGGFNQPTPGNFMAMDVYGLVCTSGVIGSTDRSSLVTYLGALQGRSI